MVETLTARFLDRSTIDKAYPLVRDVVPGMTAARWARFVRLHLVARSSHRPRGVMTIQNAAGCILSLFAFEVRADFLESRIFCVDYIIVPSLPGRGAIWASAIGAAERLAEMNGCGAIQVEFGVDSEHSEGDLLIPLAGMGYSRSGVRALKRLEAKSGHAGYDSESVAHPPRGLSDA